MPCDGEFDSIRVFQTLSNLGVNYLIPKRLTNTERADIETLEEANKQSLSNQRQPM